MFAASYVFACETMYMYMCLTCYHYVYTEAMIDALFQNVAPNHRANDVMVLEERAQMFSARFMYGPLDMVTLTGEKVKLTT